MNNHAIFIKNMERICPSVSSSISAHWDQPITNYIKHIGNFKNKPKTEISQAARKLFLNQLQLHAEKHLPDIDVKKLIEQFCNSPIIQTGPHCQLYFDGMNFNAIMMSLMHANMTNKPFIFILNSSLVTLQSRSETGPAWIPMKSKSLKILKCSNLTLKNSSVCCIKNNLLSLNDAMFDNLDSDEYEGMKRLEKIVKNIQGSNLADAFNETNSAFVSTFSGNKINSIIIDERFCAQLLIAHLSDTTSFIYKIFSNKSRLLVLLKIMKLFKDNMFGEFLAEGTALFWGLGNKKIKRLTLNEAELFLEFDSEYRVELTPEGILKSLIDEKIVPNMFLCYLVSVLLPHIHAWGGTRMIVYYPLYIGIIKNFLDVTNKDEKDLLNEIETFENFAWGANVIQESTPPIAYWGSLKKGHELEDTETYYKNIKLCETTKDLKIFKTHPLWAKYMEVI